MNWSDLFSRELTRLRLVLAAMLGALVFLAAMLWHIQVMEVRKYRGSAVKQSVRKVRLPGVRGRIFDRNGVCLADNRPSYCLAVYIEELRQPGRWDKTLDKVEGILDALSDLLGMERTVTREDIRNHIKQRLYMPFIAWRDLDAHVLAKWAESNTRFPGVDIYVEPVRFYPFGGLASHVLGYVGRADPEDEDESGPFHYYLPEMEGKWGIESVMNERLAGIPGGRGVIVDASGYKRALTGEKLPQPGKDLVLTLDARIQEAVEQALTNANGAAVVLDARNGDVLAMASSPSFDPNTFSLGMTRSEWEALSKAEDKPMFNRAVSGAYAPGSVFKPVVVLAALERGRATANTSFNCPGYFQLGDVKFHCWQKQGHGVIALRKAVEQSCNAYFCQLGLLCGFESVHDMAASIGLGRPTGIELAREESAGLIPNNAWKVKTQHDRWRNGDTCNGSIGQGAVTMTPLQVALLASAIGNGGSIYRPRLIRDGNPRGERVRRLPWSNETLRVLRGGMYDVIQSDTGTGKRARISQVEMAGKTGTAEFGPKEKRKKNAWMMVFAPFEKPRYAMAMVVEEAVSGGISVAPLMRRVAEATFALEEERRDISARVARGDGTGE